MCELMWDNGHFVTATNFFTLSALPSNFDVIIE